MTTKPTLDLLNPSICPKGSSFHDPSVPISVYRELVRELQTTRERVDSLKERNHQLVRSNRQLRQEIEKMVERGKYLDRVLQTLDETRENNVPSFVIPTRARVITPPGRVSRPPETRSEILEPSPVLPPDASRKEFSLKGWMMLPVVLAVVLTSGFGTFWFVSSTKR